MIRPRWIGPVVALALVASACESSDDPQGNGGSGNSDADVKGDDNGKPVSAAITAAAGGTVEAPGVKLTIPAGALGEDTEITVTKKSAGGLPSEADIAAAVYDFGPDGLTFLVPVTLEIELGSAAAPEGKEPVMARLEGDKWVPLAGSTVEGGKVTAPTTHFSLYTIIWKGDGSGSSCESLSFEPCGGDITGTWSYTLGCFEHTGGDAVPQCPAAQMAIAVDLSGTVSFKSDGNCTTNQTLVVSKTLTIPKSCLPDGMSCSDLGDEDDAPAIDKGDACEQSETDPPKTDEDVGTYTTSGSQLLIDDEAHDYCVSGGTLWVRVVKDEGTIYYEATQQ